MRTSFLLVLALAAARPVFPQTHAAAGAIEGTVTDQAGSAVPGVTVIITNTSTSVERAVFTNEHGFFRALMLAPGSYRIVARVPGFQRFEQSGTTVHAGETVVVNTVLRVGDTEDAVTVRGDPLPPSARGRVDAARVVTRREIEALPMPSRNVLNATLWTAAVAGAPDFDGNTPPFSANGLVQRGTFQLDGLSNTAAAQPGVALMPLSEVMVGEARIVTAGYAPEFGSTGGALFNAVTPAGTNRTSGAATYLFSRGAMTARPFLLSREAAASRGSVDIFNASVAGPVVRDLAHFYAGFEQTTRDLSDARPMSILPAEATALGLPVQGDTVPGVQRLASFVGKIESQVARAHRVTVRQAMVRVNTPNGGQTSGRDALESMTDRRETTSSTGVHVGTTLGSRQLHEFRFEYAHRTSTSSPSIYSGRGPSLDVGGIRFGTPVFDAAAPGFQSTERIIQIADSYSLLRSSHHYKFGGDLQALRLRSTPAPLALFMFPSIVSYQAAVSGANPFAYAQYAHWPSGGPVESLARFASVFVQDDWQFSSAVKIVYGLRYDRYRTPDGNIDGNNWGPRAGVAWAWSDRTVLRASTGLRFERPHLTIYDTAARSGTLTIVEPATAGAPRFDTSPDTVAAPVSAVPSRVSVDAEFESGRTWQHHVQLERSVARDYAVSLGYVHAQHANLPTVTDTNLINPVALLADGRARFSPHVTAATRVDPRFNHVYTWQAAGTGSYNALTVGLARRYVRGLSMDLFYTLSRALDAAPFADRLPAAVAVSSHRDEVRSDPAAIERDRARAALDVRHHFAATIVYNPAFAVSDGVMGHVLNGNQFGAVVHAHSGVPYTLRAARDLNGDGIANDRPLFAERNAATLPARYNVDLRYSRHIAAGLVRGEIIGEFRNLFNRRQVAAVNTVVDVDAAGTVLGDSGASLATGVPVAWYPARQFQLGFRLRF